ncbi:MAG: hypothetical protein ABIO40_11095 [Devosia sp.]
MADYKELLRRAVEALPENNGAARRAVYEKARAALVGQLRAINPPLPARDITTHRLQLEDCIRQVEQAASEAVIANIGQEPPPSPPAKPVSAISEPPKTASKQAAAVPSAELPKPLPKPVTAAPPPPKPPSPPVKPLVTATKPAESRVFPKPNGDARPAPVRAGSIEDIIANADRERPSSPTPPQKPEIRATEPKRPPKSHPVLVAKNNAPQPAANEPEHERPAARQSGRPLPSIVARAEAARNRPVTQPAEPAQRRAPSIEPRRESRSGGLAARKIAEVSDDMEAMSSVREVEVEFQPTDPQGAIDRAIATLDREARGDTLPPLADDPYDDEPMQAPPRRNGAMNGSLNDGFRRDDMPLSRNGRDRDRDSRPKPAREFATSARRVPRAQAERERGGMGAVTVFLIVFVVLLLGAGGAGFWAWQEGFINLDAMFGKGQPAVVAAAAQTTTADGPGNTETALNDAQPETELPGNERLGTEENGEKSAALALQPGSDTKIDDRLDSGTGPSEDPLKGIDSATAAGSQSLLLEASDKGTSGAVPFSGTVEWSRSVDETGQPTLVGKANIPARNLQVSVLIRKNSDPALPASHLMEINFTVSDTFLGGSIAGLPGVLLKDQELTGGQPLVGASARVVGNSFLFALSATPEDSAANVKLLTSRKWIDLALIYATGKRAIITLEKDANAQQLFAEVFAAWGSRASS